MTLHQKLVRDKIPEMLLQVGIQPFTHVAAEHEYQSKLSEKLGEEMDEFRAGGETEELADLLEVIYAIAALRGLGPAELESLRLEKAEARGGFARRIILERTEP